jgi:hypothetical protein
VGKNPFDYLARQATGDWGDLCAFDRRQNEVALRTGERVFSPYGASAGRIWVITEADRSVTTKCLPDDHWCPASCAAGTTAGSRHRSGGDIVDSMAPSWQSGE